MRNSRTATFMVARRGFMLSLVFLAATALTYTQSTWLGSAWRFRVPVSVSAGAYERLDMPAEVSLNFTQLMASKSFNGSFIENSLRVVEVNVEGTIIDTSVAFQFDKDADYNPSSKASGRIILLMDGTTIAGGSRSYQVYFQGGQGTFQPAQVSALVTLTDNIVDAGQSSFRIQAVGSTYYYHKQGAGFSSWIDANGNDWLNFDGTPGSGSAGEYRGIPNAVYPEGHFHPGKTSSTSNIVSTGPVKATFRSATTDGKWECLWEIYPRFARMTMVRADHGYWLLYEGTPGGVIQPSTDFMYRSDGTKTFLSSSWTADIASNEWTYFSDPNVGTGGRSLFFVHDEDDTALDSYWTMENNMTVFGYGRNNSPTAALITAVPQHLTIGLMEGTLFSECSKIVTGAYKLLSISAGAVEELVAVAPLLLSPADGTTGLPNAVDLRWASVAGASSYHLQAGRDTSFTFALTLDDSTIVDTVETAGGLNGGTVYYWRVRATVSGVKGPWSERRAFSTALSVPELENPADGAVVSMLTPTIQWRSVPLAIGYRLQVSSDPTFSGGTIVDEWNAGDTIRTLPALAEGVTYFWRVAARTSQVTGPFSGSWRFSTSIVLLAPRVLQPSNHAAGLPTTLVFRWESVAGAITYHLQAASDSTFAGGFVKNDSSVADTFRTVIGFAHGTTYYWRVRARVASGNTPFSTTWSFSTAIQLPGQPALLLPAEGENIRTDPVTFAWNRVEPGVTSYWLEIGLDAAFSFSLVDSMHTDTTTTVHIQVRDKTYWWRVRGKNEGGWGPFSPVRTFVAVDPNGIQREDEIPRELSLEQNFPNPFNPTTQIRFALPAQRQVRLEVISLLGERVAMLVDDVLPAGIYMVQMDGHRLSSGVYYYRLITPATTITRRMLLIK